MKREQAVSLSPKLLTAIECEASRHGRSTSWCVHRAWIVARPELATLAAPTPIPQNVVEPMPEPEGLRYTHPRAEAIYAERYRDDEQRLHRLYFSDEMLSDIAGEARRLARPLSWVVERAWCLAADDIARLSSPG